MVETKCGCRFLGWSWTHGLAPPFWICRLLPGVLGKFSQQALRLTSRQNSPETTGDEAGSIARIFKLTTDKQVGRMVPESLSVKPDVLLMATLQTSATTLILWLTVSVEQVAACVSKLPSSGFHCAVENEVRQAQFQINRIILPNICCKSGN